MINFHEIIEPIEQAIISWTQCSALTAPVKILQDLTNAEVFIFFLSKVHFFQFVQPCNYTNFTQLSLGERIGRMKMIGRSIVKHYKCEMMKDLGDTHFNFVEMCTDNKQELMKLIIMFMGIIVTNEQILQQLEHYIANSNQENTAYLTIMIEYARKMTQNQQEFTESSPVKKQKRLITKLEILEEQIEFYEEYTRELEGKIQHLTEEADKYQKTIAQQSNRSSQMLKRIEELQSNNEQLLREISKKTANEELLNAKLSKNRQLADETINRLLLDIEKAKQQTLYYKQCVVKYEQVEAINKQLNTTNAELLKQILSMKTKNQKNLENLHRKDKQLEDFTKITNDLMLQNDSLKVKIELIEKSFTNNRSIHFSPQQKSVVVHNPLSLSTSSNQNNFMWFNFKERDMDMTDQNLMNDSLTLTLRSNTSYCENKPLPSKKSQQNKENCMKMGNTFNEAPEYLGELNNICEQKSFELNMENINSLMKLKQQRDLQFLFAIQMITQIYDYMQSLRKELKKYQLKEAKQMERTLTFKQKVNKMFA